MSSPSPKETHFADEWLAKLVADRGAMANLRRGLGKPPGTVHQMDRNILPFLSGEPEKPYYLVAALFAGWHQGKDSVVTNPPDNLGKSLKAIVEKEVKEGRKREDVEDRLEKRLVALLNCHRDDLPQHLRQVVGLLRSKEVAINWAQLLHDIRGWNWESRAVQRAWARGFWSVPEADIATQTSISNENKNNEEGEEE